LTWKKPLFLPASALISYLIPDTIGNFAIFLTSKVDVMMAAICERVERDRELSPKTCNVTTSAQLPTLTY